MIDRTPSGVWTRKHDDPREPGRHVAIAYPKNLAELIELCSMRAPGEFLHAAGSHYALSDAALSDTTYIETHDPNLEPSASVYHQAMAQTLQGVIPECMNGAYIDRLALDDSHPYLVHVQAGKRIYQLYAEFDEIQPLVYPLPKDAQDAMLREPEFPAADPPFVEGAAPKQTLAGRLNDLGRPEFKARYAFPTLGSAGFQTVVGAFSTGTHGGDFDRGPVSDSVVAIHLVVDGGDHYWIEPSPTNDWPALTDDAILHARYDRANANVKFHIERDDKLFNAILVSAGRFGVIYSVVLKAIRQYTLHEERRLTTWGKVKDQIRDQRSELYSHGTQHDQYTQFLQIVVNLSPSAFFSENQAGVTKRWPTQYFGDQDNVAGRCERIGPRLDEFRKQIQAPFYKNAGTTNAFSDGTSDLLDIACSQKSFLSGALKAVVDEIEHFASSNGVEVGATIAAVGYAAGAGAVAGLLALLPQLSLIVMALRAVLSLIDNDTRFGELVNDLKNTLLKDPPPGVTRDAGVFVWQLIAYTLFKTQQDDNDIEGVSYAILDNHDYHADASCQVNVDSMEVFFDSMSDNLIAFIDQLLAFEVRQQYQGKAAVGYASIRLTGPTRATLGAQLYNPTAVVEVSALKDVSGSESLVSFACGLARSETFGGILHWGQRNDCTQNEIEARFGDAVGYPPGRLGAWRDALAHFTDNGRLNGFSNAFSRRTGLEVVQPRIGSFEADVLGGAVRLHWDCRSNPPATRASLIVRYTLPAGDPVGKVLSDPAPLEGTFVFPAPQYGTFEFELSLELTTNQSRTARQLLQRQVNG